MKKVICLFTALLILSLICAPALYVSADDASPLSFTALEDNSGVIVKIIGEGTYSLEYATGGEWIGVVFDENGSFALEMQKDETVLFRGNNTMSFGMTDYLSFDGMGKLEVTGDITTLLDPAGNVETLADGTGFYKLFAGNTALVSASGLILPSSVLSASCYDSMFMGCENLESAPALPALTLAPYCYANMFNGCKNLKKAPDLPAQTLANGCYSGMFAGCIAMGGSPNLPAAELVRYCYTDMFNGCSSLSGIKVAFTEWDANDAATQNWLGGVSEMFFFDCPVALEEFSSESRIPNGATITHDGIAESVYAQGSVLSEGNTLTIVIIAGIAALAIVLLVVLKKTKKI